MVEKTTINRAVGEPSECSPDTELISLDDFVRADFQVLAEFLRSERDEMPHYREYMSWELLVGDKLKYSDPERYIQKEKRRISKHKNDGIEMRDRDDFPEIEGRSQVLEKHVDTYALAYVNSVMEMMMFESIVTYARRIGEENQMSPMEVVRSLQGRNEIFRRMFESDKTFINYHHNLTQMKRFLCEGASNAFDVTQPYVEFAQKIPFIRNIVNFLVLRQKNKIPPMQDIESFAKKDADYIAERARTIYCADKTV